jgi:hypothetical protein
MVSTSVSKYLNILMKDYELVRILCVTIPQFFEQIIAQEWEEKNER